MSEKELNEMSDEGKIMKKYSFKLDWTFEGIVEALTLEEAKETAITYIEQDIYNPLSFGRLELQILEKKDEG